MNTALRLGILIGLFVESGGPLRAQGGASMPRRLYECRVAAQPGVTLEHAGPELSPAGDFNGDGHGDLLVQIYNGGIYEGPRGGGYCEIEVISGRDGTSLWAWPGLSPSKPECVIAAAGVGDVNGDRKDDLIVTVVSSVEVSFPLLRIVLGGTAETLRAFQSDDPEVNVGLLGFGTVVGGTGDVDADGVSDYFVAAPEQPGGRHGNAGHADLLGVPYKQKSGNGYFDVYSGKTGSRLWRQSHINFDNGFAYAAASIGDVDRDGVPDLVVGGPPSLVGFIAQPTVTEGGFFTLSGVDGKVLCYRAGRWDDDALGRSVIPIGDVDGDGSSDVAVGAGSQWTDCVLDVVIARATDGQILRTLDRALLGETCVTRVRSAGDLDGDGRQELVMYPGRQPKSRSARSCLRQVHIIEPRSGLSLARVSGSEESDLFGCAAGSAGDADGDGRGDLAVCESLVDEGGTVVALIRVYKFDD